MKQLISIIGNTLQIRLIKTELSIEEALRRIESRSSKDTRVEAMKTKQKKIELMKRYEFASNQISNMKPIKEIGIYEPFGE